MGISKDLQDKIALLKKWDDSYYNKNESVVPDKKYDIVKDYIVRKLPPGSPELKEILKKVGHTASSGWTKEAHSIAMGSQNKVSNAEAIKNWVKDVAKKATRKIDKYILQHKIDGFSLELKYEKGKLVSGVTRGDGVTGENITNNVMLFREVPKIVQIDKDFVVRAEAYINDDDFDIIQDLTGNGYKNPRNAASGISRRFDGKFSEFIRVFAFDVTANTKSELEKIKILEKLGFTAVPTVACESLEDILEVYDQHKEVIRNSLGYKIDGLVLKIDDIETQEELGTDRNRPNGQVALKFDSDQAITVLDRIELQIGRTGKVTPLGMLEPVDMMGSTITKATLHNFAWIESNFVSPGAEVVIEKKGDIIPQVVEVMMPGDGYERPEECPSCGKPLSWDGVNLWCRNEGCKDRETARIAYWMKTLDMKGFSDSFVEKLWDTGKIRNVGDLYKLTIEDLADIPGLGVKTIKSFLKSLESTSEMYLEKFIVALGIPTVSNSTSQILVKEFGDWGKITDLCTGDLERLPGFAKISSENVINGIQEVSDMADDLLKVIKIKERKSGTLTGKSFCVTGSLSSMSRKEFEAFVEEHGGVPKSGVSAGLSYLVTNSPDSGTGKNAKVARINAKVSDPSEKIHIITEKEFLDLAGENPSKKDKSEDKTDEKKESDDGPVLEFYPLF